MAPLCHPFHSLSCKHILRRRLIQSKSKTMKVTTVLVLATSVLAESSAIADARCDIKKHRVTIGELPTAFMYEYDIEAHNVGDISVGALTPYPKSIIVQTFIKKLTSLLLGRYRGFVGDCGTTF